MDKETAVPPTPYRRRVASALVAAVVGTLVLAGCGTGQGQAGNYSELEDNFMAGCESTVEQDADVEGAEQLPDDFCRCAFDALSGEGDAEGVEFDELMAINDELKEDPAQLPEEVTQAFADCAQPG